MPQLQRGSLRDDRCAQGDSSGEEEEAGDEEGVDQIGGVQQAEGDGTLGGGFTELAEQRVSY